MQQQSKAHTLPRGVRSLLVGLLAFALLMAVGTTGVLAFYELGAAGGRNLLMAGFWAACALGLLYLGNRLFDVAKRWLGVGN